VWSVGGRKDREPDAGEGRAVWDSPLAAAPFSCAVFAPLALVALNAAATQYSVLKMG